MIGIVRAAHGIEIQLLQEEDVLQHACLCQGLSPALIMLVPTHSLDQDWLVIMQQLLALDLIPLEAHLKMVIEALTLFHPSFLPLAII